jgi:hypothetical protein
MIGITSWFADGSKEAISWESLRAPDESRWITSDEARELENRLYGPRPTVREQVSILLRKNWHADYWEKLVLRVAEALLARVDEELRGIPIKEAGLELMTSDDYMNLPEGPLEIRHGVPSPRHWRISQEGRRRLGFATVDEEEEAFHGKTQQEVDAEFERRRAALRAKPFVPSEIPFSSGRPEER